MTLTLTVENITLKAIAKQISKLRNVQKKKLPMLNALAQRSALSAYARSRRLHTPIPSAFAHTHAQPVTHTAASPPDEHAGLFSGRSPTTHHCPLPLTIQRRPWRASMRMSAADREFVPGYGCHYLLWPVGLSLVPSFPSPCPTPPCLCVAPGVSQVFVSAY